MDKKMKALLDKGHDGLVSLKAKITVLFTVITCMMYALPAYAANDSGFASNFENVKAGGKEMIENIFNLLQLVFCLGGGLGLIIAAYQLIQSLGARDGAEKSNATLHLAVAAATIGLGLGLGVFESSILKMLGLS